MKTKQNPFAHYGTGDNLKPFQEAKRRESAIADGLRQIASACGFKLNEPLQIDSNGEFSIVSESDYGKKFVALLNASGGARTGIYPTSHMLPENNWCRLNHFAAQWICEQVIETEVDCPDCYGEHFRPCQMCSDTGKVTEITLT